MFKDDAQLAIIGEYVVICALLDFHGIKNAFDVRHDKRFQEWDVDFLVLDKNLQVTWVEVKTDMAAYRTGNFFYETESHGKTGCLEKNESRLCSVLRSAKWKHLFVQYRSVTQMRQDTLV